MGCVVGCAVGCRVSSGADDDDADVAFGSRTEEAGTIAMSTGAVLALSSRIASASRASEWKEMLPMMPVKKP